jgi:S1-C subfamily serine protease
MLHTGLHDNYHRPSDDVETVNTAGTQRVARLLVGLVEEVAHRPQLPSFRARSRVESLTTQPTAERPLAPLPGRLGVSWQPDDNQSAGLRVTRVRPGSAADRGGIRAGDRITHFAGREITDAEAFRSLVLAAANPVPVTMVRANPGESEEVQLTLDGTPTRLGIAWRMDDAEPESVTLVRVVPGSPADRAGLKVHDRVYQVSGRDFASSEEFQSLVTADVPRLELTVERQGRISDITVEPVLLQ